MSEFSFPEKRFAEADVSQDAIDTMRRQFNASDVTVQRAQVEYWATQSFGGLRDYVATHITPELSETRSSVDSGDSESESVENDVESEDESSDVDED